MRCVIITMFVAIAAFTIETKKLKISRRATKYCVFNPILDAFKKIQQEGQPIVDTSYGHASINIAPEIRTLLMNHSNDRVGKLALEKTDRAGLPRLRQALAKLYGGLMHRVIDPLSEVVITIGATQAFDSAIKTLVNPGEEVILIEPNYFVFNAVLQANEAIVRTVRMRSPYETRSDGVGTKSSNASMWRIDMEEFESMINRKTKVIILTNPSNPTGKVFSRQELSNIASLCKRYDLFMLVDEVFDFLIMPHANHVRISSLPGMWNRTITIGSASKSWNVHGFRIGWAYGPPELIKYLQHIVTVTVNGVPTLLQQVIAEAFENQFPIWDQPQSYNHRVLYKEMIPKQRAVLRALKDVELPAVWPDGTIYIVVNLTPLLKYANLENFKAISEYPLVEWVSRVKKVHMYPLALFYTDPHSKWLVRNSARITYIRDNVTIQKLIKLIQNFAPR